MVYVIGGVVSILLGSYLIWKRQFPITGFALAIFGVIGILAGIASFLVQ